jgi:hypothetical protein
VSAKPPFDRMIHVLASCESQLTGVCMPGFRLLTCVCLQPRYRKPFVAVYGWLMFTGAVVLILAPFIVAYANKVSSRPLFEMSIRMICYSGYYILVIIFGVTAIVCSVYVEVVVVVVVVVGGVVGSVACVYAHVGVFSCERGREIVWFDVCACAIHTTRVHELFHFQCVHACAYV